MYRLCLQGIGILSICGVTACTEYELSPKLSASEGIDSGEPDPVTPPSDPDTGTPPDCSDFVPAGIGGVDLLEDCARTPEIGSFTPTIEWQWDANPIHGSYNQIMAAPAIANLNDDNGDGRVNEDDIPDVVFTTFTGSAYGSPGTVTAIRGTDGSTLWSVTSPGGYPIFGASGVAIGDIEGNGDIEVCVSGQSVSVVCLHGADGGFKWSGGSEVRTYGCPSIADLDGDGFAEVISGRTILAHDGSTIAVGAGGSGGGHGMSFSIDWDGDGNLDVIAGNTIYRMDGTILWTDPSGGVDAAPAIGDFNLDGRPDLVRAGSGQVVVTLNDGTLLWSVATAGGGSAGAPTVADFDGDGAPEVGVADLSKYTLYDTDGSIIWSNTTSDYSSSQTGSSVFDFEGDGAAEVVYADEENLWIYDGATGAVKMQQEGHSSGTLMEYPLIADVDHDGSTEIVVASNDYRRPGWTGITVIGDATGTWAAARPVWNQYAYHITNVNNDGTIPRTQTPNWRSWNSFRAGGTELGPSHWLPDLTTQEPDICTETCWAGTVQLYLPVTNQGLIEATSVVVTIDREDGTRIFVDEFGPVLSADGWNLGPITLSDEDWGDGNLTVFVDWPEDVDECREGNNRRNLGPWPCP